MKKIITSILPVIILLISLAAQAQENSSARAKTISKELSIHQAQAAQVVAIQESAIQQVRSIVKNPNITGQERQAQVRKVQLERDEQLRKLLTGQQLQKMKARSSAVVFAHREKKKAQNQEQADKMKQAGNKGARDKVEVKQ